MSDGNALSVKLDVGTFAATLGLLVQGGLRFGSFIDIGSADGYFGLAFWRAGLFRETAIVNIDANPVYEPSLRKIRDAIGGDFRICAVDEREGTLALHTSEHPYWGSAVPPEDAYWSAINGQIGATVTVPCRRLDTIVEEMRLKPPYAIKLDIQGLEVRALRSGPRALADTAAVVCEVVARDFHDIHSLLVGAGFELHDLTDINRTADHTLGWFYATYLHRNYAVQGARPTWTADANAAVLEQQRRRREQLIGSIDALVAVINAEKKQPAQAAKPEEDP